MTHYKRWLITKGDSLQKLPERKCWFSDINQKFLFNNNVIWKWIFLKFENVGAIFVYTCELIWFTQFNFLIENNLLIIN